MRKFNLIRLELWELNLILVLEILELNLIIEYKIEVNLSFLGVLELLFELKS